MAERKNYMVYILIVLSILFIPFAYVYAIYLILRDLAKKDYKSIKYIAKNKYLLFISISVLISIIFSKYKEVSSLFGVMILACIGVISYLATNFSTDDLKNVGYSVSEKYEFTKLLKLIYITSLISYAIGIFQMFDPMYLMPNKWVDMSEYNLKKRIFASFFNPNIFGFYINIIIMLICTQFSLTKDKIKKSKGFDFIEKITFIISVICLFFTFSRASWISIIAALFLIGLVFDKKYILFSIFIFICIFGMDTILGINRADITKLAEDSSLSYRIELWKISYSIIKDNIIAGIGFGTFFKYTALYSNVIKGYIEHCHNIFLQIFMDTGIIGFTTFLATLFLSTKKLIKESILNRNNKFSIFLLLLLVMTLTHGLVDAVSLMPQIMFILSLIVGIYLSKAFDQKTIN